MCGICGGRTRFVDIAGVCCASMLDGQGRCCRGALDECGVCGGDNACEFEVRFALQVLALLLPEGEQMLPLCNYVKMDACVLR